MRRVFLAMVLSVSTTAASRADIDSQASAEHDTAAAEAFVEFLRIGETYDAAIEDLKAQQARQVRMISMLGGGNVDDVVSDYAKKINQLIDKAFDREDILRQYADAYASTFDAAELDTLKGFFTTPEGEKFLRESDRIEAGVTRALQPKLHELQESVQYLQEDMMATLKNDVDPNSPLAQLQTMLQQKMQERGDSSTEALSGD